DIIQINIPDKRLIIKLEEKEIEERLERLKRPTLRAKSGYLNYYTNLVGSADKGAVRR
ncbi:MAG: dihydroxy-acid dehydratase, partial [Candidatus Atribacteria bacterium]|nr:dihydroxy-acid dehydratase [Candidatus Atribacteria bacterium]